MTKWFASKNHDDYPDFKKELAVDNREFVSHGTLPRISQLSSIESWKRENLSRDSLESRIESDSVNTPLAIVDPNLISTYLAQLEPSTTLDYRQANFVNGISIGENRYALGIEFAITALIAFAAITKFRRDDKPEISDVMLTNRIEDIAYDSPDSKNDSIKELQIPKCLEDYSGGFSGSLTDFMFGSNVHRPTFIIGSGDTLVSIAESLFHDSKLAYLIAELNRDRTNQIYKDDRLIVEANSRDVLKLPLGNDISEFHSKDTKDLIPEKLITIVKETSLNKELIEDVLMPIVAPTITWPSSKVSSAIPKSKGDKLKFYNFQNRVKRSHAKLKTIVLNGIKVNRSIDN